MSCLANHEFLKMEEVLNQTVDDCLSYMQYQNAKVLAESAQQKFILNMNKHKK